MQPNSGFHYTEPAYLRRLLRMANISQAKAATLLDISLRALEEYLAGRLEVPYLVQFGLERLADISEQQMQELRRAEDEAFEEVERRQQTT